MWPFNRRKKHSDEFKLVLHNTGSGLVISENSKFIKLEIALTGELKMLRRVWEESGANDYFTKNSSAGSSIIETVSVDDKFLCIVLRKAKLSTHILIDFVYQLGRIVGLLSGKGSMFEALLAAVDEAISDAEKAGQNTEGLQTLQAFLMDMLDKEGGNSKDISEKRGRRKSNQKGNDLSNLIPGDDDSEDSEIIIRKSGRLNINGKIIELSEEEVQTFEELDPAEIQQFFLEFYSENERYPSESEIRDFIRKKGLKKPGSNNFDLN